MKENVSQIGALFMLPNGNFRPFISNFHFIKEENLKEMFSLQKIFSGTRVGGWGVSQNLENTQPIKYNLT